jgi:hypothetical protein
MPLPVARGPARSPRDRPADAPPPTPRRPRRPTQLEQYKSAVAYARADFINLQQRTKTEKERVEKFALQVGRRAWSGLV